VTQDGVGRQCLSPALTLQNLRRSATVGAWMSLVGTTYATYSVLEKLSRGGMADIYLATDETGQKYILRVLLPEFHDNRKYTRRFRWGCKAMSQLDHPNVVRLVAHGESRDQYYAVMEYVDGTNLKERIIRGDPQLRPHQLGLLLGMAAGLAHVHDRGFIHLDFKPENVVVSGDYEPKIVDFDLSIARPSEPRRISTLSGTPSYLAPEQIMREPVDERADIFAFGLTAYEMLSGRKPVTGDTREEVLQKYMDFNKHLVPLRSRVPDIPRAIEHVVLKCLEKDVRRRYPSMALVLRDLHK
jgi:eukaryotic-like serine/threonine-protein kinase